MCTLNTGYFSIRALLHRAKLISTPFFLGLSHSAVWLLMRILRRASLDEVRAEFLYNEMKPYRKEYARLRVLDMIAACNPALVDSDSVNRRRRLLKYRDPVLRRIPEDTEWFEAEIDTKDYEELHMIRDASWMFLSMGTGRLEVAARELQNYRRNSRYPLLREERTIADDVINFWIPRVVSGDVNRRFILLRDCSGNTVVVEGNHRALAIYAIEIDEKIRELDPHSVLLGLSLGVYYWNWPTLSMQVA